MIIDTIQQYITDNNLADGFTFKLFRWNDADAAAREQFFVLRSIDTGVGDYAIGDEAYQIELIGHDNQRPSEVNSAAETVRDTMFRNYTAGEIMYFEVLSIAGPIFIYNNRPKFTIDFVARVTRSLE